MKVCAIHSQSQRYIVSKEKRCPAKRNFGGGKHSLRVAWMLKYVCVECKSPPPCAHTPANAIMSFIIIRADQGRLRPKIKYDSVRFEK